MKINQNIDRRNLIKTGLGAGAASLLVSPISAEENVLAQVDISTPESRFNTHVKMVGSQEEESVYVWFDGGLWGIMPGKAPVVLCGFQGLAKSNWMPQDDGSTIQHSFDVGIFSDMETGEPLETLLNPLTGETIKPFHYQYGGYQQHHKPDNELYSDVSNNKWSLRGDEIAFREYGSRTFDHPIPADKWPRESAGDKYLAASETNYMSPISQVADDAIKNADYRLFWTAILSWEPWLLMDGVPGFVMWRGIGRKVKSYNEAPEPLLNHIRKVQPNYFEDKVPWDGVMSSIEEFMKQREPSK